MHAFLKNERPYYTFVAIRFLVMNKLFSVVLGSFLLCSCSVTQKTEVSKFTVDMNVVKTNRPDLYERYMKGEIVIDDVYLDQTNSIPYHGVDYHAVQFIPANAGK